MTRLDLATKLIPTLYEDEFLLAVDKPAGIDSTAGSDSGAPGTAELLAQYRTSGETLHVVKRLTRHESGILLFAKDSTTRQYVRSALNAGKLRQEYVAVVLGRMTQRRMTIDLTHGASHGRARSRAPAPSGQRRNRPSRTGSKPGDAGTAVTMLGTGQRLSLVRCQTNVQSPHNLRAQLRAVRLRVLGDNVHDKSTRGRRPEHMHMHLAKLTLRHPQQKKQLVISCPAPPSFRMALTDVRDVVRPLRAALARRLPLLVERDTNAYRLLTGDREGLVGLIAERFGNVILLHFAWDRSGSEASLAQVARWYRDMLGIQAVYAKPLVKSRMATGSDTVEDIRSPEPILGTSVPSEIEIHERGLRFAIRPYDGFAVGLYPDHRENRSRIRSSAADKRVLNLFAYTCSFSVAAAAGRAESTVSVDLSPKNLDWGRTNFSLNGIDPTAHEFVCTDALDYLGRAKRQGKRFDVVVLDPPSFAHGRKTKRTFSVMTDLVSVISGAVALLNPGGLLMVSTNYRRMSLPGLRDRLSQGARGRPYQIEAAPRLPLDFAMDPDHAKTVFARFR